MASPVLLDGKRLLITGGARGIGLGIAHWFLAHGYRVALLDIDPSTLAGTAAQLQDPARVLTLHCDVSQADQVQALFEFVDRECPPLHALVNNAGISPKGPGGSRLNTLETDLRTWGQVFHVNFFASIVLARGLKDELSAAKGSVVNVTSIAGSPAAAFALRTSARMVSFGSRAFAKNWSTPV